MSINSYNDQFNGWSKAVVTSTFPETCISYGSHKYVYAWRTSCQHSHQRCHLVMPCWTCDRSVEITLLWLLLCLEVKGRTCGQIQTVL